MTEVRPSYLFGPLSGLGLVFALLAFGLDQAMKWWMLGPFDIASRQPVALTPFLDLVLAWNRGVSYGMFEQSSEVGRWALVGISLIAAIVLWGWMARTIRPLTAAALGLVVGGALGNALDRVLYGAVADFFLAHAWGYSWYVFNLADTAIVAGVALLLYETWSESRRVAP